MLVNFFNTRSWATKARFCAGMGLMALAGTASAQRVLVLTTTEAAGDAIIMQRNCISEFQNSSATTVDVRAGSLNNAVPLTAADFTPPAGAYDVVVTCTVYNAATAANVAVIDTAIRTRAAQAFFLFDEAGSFFPTLTAAKTGWTLTPAGNGGFSTQTTLNTASRFSGDFVGLNPYGAHSFGTYSGVPLDNALYLPPAVAVPTPPFTPDQTIRASAMLVPTVESYVDGNGVPQGACLFYNTDVSGFDQVRYPNQPGKIATAFLAATAPGGACAIPARVTKAFAPASVSPGATSTLTITMENHASPAEPVSGLNVTDNLPAPLVVAGTPTTTCTGGTLAGSDGAAAVSLTNATLPVAGCIITVPVRWPDTQQGLAACGTGAVVTNTITPGRDFTTAYGQSSSPATATLACVAVGRITISKALNTAAPLAPGAAVQYTVVVSNTGAVSAAGATTVVDPLPTGLASGTWTCAGTCGSVTNGSLPLSHTLTDLPAGAVATYTISATVGAAGLPAVITNTATANPATPSGCAGGVATCSASASAAVALPPSAAAHPVPAMSTWMWLLMSLALCCAAVGLPRKGAR